MADAVKRNVVCAFKMHGLSLKSDASNFLTEMLVPVNAVEREDLLDRILDQLQKQTLTSNMIGVGEIELAVKECNSGDEESYQALTVIDAFDVPKYTYLPEKKKFVLQSENGKEKISGDAACRSRLYWDRYHVLHQRTMRHKLFTPPILGMEDDVTAKKFKLRTVEFLLGCSSKLKDIIVLGMIAQLKERKYYLEDLTGAVELDLGQAKFHSGIFTENCFILAEGWYDDSIFHITAVGFPPPELSKTARAYYGNINFFGGKFETCPKASSKLLQIEKENEAMMVILSDVWLDQEKVLKKLETMFEGFRDLPPTCFIFGGSFVSEPYGSAHFSLLKDSFTYLLKILLKFPRLCQKSKFVFVPSLDDVGPAKILPRPALPRDITESFCQKVPNAIFTSNPCRIRYCTQEIVVFREDIVHKMVRNSFKCSDEHIPTHFVKTIIAQAHLSPLPLGMNPIYWQHDQALRLYPLPDLVVIADHLAESFQESTELDCLIANPGSFSRGDFSFKVYYPATKTMDDSRIVD